MIRQIRKEKLPVRVVLLSALLDDHELIEALTLGVSGNFFEGMAPQLLIQCIRTVHSGGRWLERVATGRALDSLVQREASRHEAADVLTERQVEIVRLIAQGLRNGEIAQKLFIDEGTVKVHLHKVSGKLNLRGRHALAVYARDKGLA